VPLERNENNLLGEYRERFYARLLGKKESQSVGPENNHRFWVIFGPDLNPVPCHVRTKGQDLMMSSQVLIRDGAENGVLDASEDREADK
jgi:hypothetical protein